MIWKQHKSKSATLKLHNREIEIFKIKLTIDPWSRFMSIAMETLFAAFWVTFVNKIWEENPSILKHIDNARIKSKRMEASVAAGKERVTKEAAAVIASEAKKMNTPYSSHRKVHGCQRTERKQRK